MLHIQYLNQLVAQCICSFACFGHNSWPSLGSWKIQHIQLNPLIKLACSLKMAKNCGRNMLEQWLRINTNTLQSGKLYEPHFFVWLVFKRGLKNTNYQIFQLLDIYLHIYWKWHMTKGKWYATSNVQQNTILWEILKIILQFPFSRCRNFMYRTDRCMKFVHATAKICVVIKLINYYF